MSWQFVCANFDQMHMDTNLRWVVDHPDAELVGVCDEQPATSTGSLQRAIGEHDVTDDAVFDDLDRCLAATDPDVVVGSPRNAEHAAFVERVAPYDVHLAIEKPMADTLANADRMLETWADVDRLLVVSWPVMWEPAIHEVRRLVASGTVGDVLELQYYGGNAGAPPDDSWFYDGTAGGGSMLDYLCYGATVSTWVRDGELPTHVTADTHVPDGSSVDVQSSAVCRYEDGLSTLHSSWRTFTHPWETRPQPALGYDVVGTRGTITTRDRDVPIRVQTESDPEGHAVDPDPLPERYTDLVHYLVDCLETGREPTGPPDPAFSRRAQRILETARRSASRDDSLSLVE